MVINNTSTIMVLRRPVESALGALVAVDHGLIGRIAIVDRHAERVGDE